jgi:putative sigma-54 modulation protein
LQITITGRHLGVTEAMKGYARTKVEKLLRHAGRTTSAAIRMDVEHGEHEVEVVLDMPHETPLVVKAAAPDMYAAVDLAEQKLAVQLRRAKERRQDHHRGEKRSDGPPRSEPTARDGESDTYEEVIERLRRGE